MGAIKFNDDELDVIHRAERLAQEPLLLDGFCLAAFSGIIFLYLTGLASLWFLVLGVMSVVGYALFQNFGSRRPSYTELVVLLVRKRRECDLATTRTQKRSSWH